MRMEFVFPYKVQDRQPLQPQFNPSNARRDHLMHTAAKTADNPQPVIRNYVGGGTSLHWNVTSLLLALISHNPYGLRQQF